MPTFDVKHLGVVVGSVTYTAITPPASLPKVKTDPTPIVNSIIARHSKMLNDLYTICQTFINSNLQSHGSVYTSIAAAKSVPEVYDKVDASKNKWTIDIDGFVSMYNDAVTAAFGITSSSFNSHFDSKTAKNDIYYYYGIHSNAKTAYNNYSTRVPGDTNAMNTRFTGFVQAVAESYNTMFASMCTAALSRSLAIALSKYRSVTTSVMSEVSACITSVRALPLTGLAPGDDPLSRLSDRVNKALASVDGASSVLNSDLAAMKYGSDQQDNLMSSFNTSVSAIGGDISTAVDSFESAVSTYISSSFDKSLAAAKAKYDTVSSAALAEIRSCVSAVGATPLMGSPRGTISALSARVNAALDKVRLASDSLNADLSAIKYSGADQEATMDEFMVQVDSIGANLSAAVDEFESAVSSFIPASFNASLEAARTKYDSTANTVLTEIRACVAAVGAIPLTESPIGAISSLSGRINAALNNARAATTELNSDLAAIEYSDSSSEAIMDDFMAHVDSINEEVSDAVAEFDSAVESRSTEYVSTTSHKSASEFSRSIADSKKSLEDEIASASSVYSAKALRDAKSAVDNYLRSHSVSKTMDSVALRSEIADIKNSLREIVSDIVGNVMSDFRDHMTKRVAQFSDDVSRHYSSLNTAMSGASINVPTLDTILAELEDTITATSAEVNSSVESYLTEVNYDTAGKSASAHEYLSSAVDQYALSVPILRITKIISFPSSFASNSFPVFSFEVSNSGDVMWLGWFGIKLVDDTGNTFTYNVRPIGMISVPGKSTRRVDLKVPVAKLVGNGTIGDVVNSTLITNTFRGSVPSLQK